jgi:hypothetical protein
VFLRFIDVSRIREESPYTLFFRVSLIIVIPALTGSLVGKLLDRLFKIEPYGSLLSLAFFYVLTWVLIFILYIKPLKNQKDKK